MSDYLILLFTPRDIYSSVAIISAETDFQYKYPSNRAETDQCTAIKHVNKFTALAANRNQFCMCASL